MTQAEQDVDNLETSRVRYDELSSSSAGEGASLVTLESGETVQTDSENKDTEIGNRVIRVSSRTEMKAYDVPAGYQFSLEEGGRSGLFVVKSGTPPSDPQEGIYIVLANGKYAERLYDGGLGYAQWFGLNLDGSDETSKWKDVISVLASENLSLGEFVGDTLISSQIVFPSGFGGICGSNQLLMSFSKGFNGEMFSLNSQGMTLKNFWIKGNGSVYSGGGLYGVSDNIAINHIRVTDTQDSCIICKSNDFTFADVDDCFLQTTDNQNVASIRSDGADISAGPTARSFSKIRGAGYAVDFSGMNYATLSKTLVSKLGYSADCSKIICTENRISAASNNIEVLGYNNIFSANDFNFGPSNDLIISGENIVFDASNNYTKGTNSKASPVINKSIGGPLNSRISSNLLDYKDSVEWRGVTSNGDFGTSSIEAYYKLSDQKCYVSFFLRNDGSATLPTGAWSISLPYKSFVRSNGVAHIQSSSGVYYSAMCRVLGGGDEVYFYLEADSEAVNGTTISFGLNAVLSFTFEYLISPS